MSKFKHQSVSFRRQQIIIAADAVLQDVGVSNFTMDQVVEYLGIAKGTIYKYFKTKFDLLAEVGVKALKLLLEYFRLSDTDHTRGLSNTKAIIMACYAYNQGFSKYFELIVYMERPEFETTEAEYKKVNMALTSFMLEHILREQKQGVLRDDLKALNINFAIWGTCMGMMNFLDSKRNFIENIEELDSKDLFETYVNIFVRGLEL